MKKATILIILLFAGGCTTSYQVQVTGFAAQQPAVPPQSQIYVRSDPNVANMLFADQIKSKIQQLLIEQGHNPVNDPDTRYRMSFLFRSNNQITYDYDSVSTSLGYGYGRYGGFNQGMYGNFGPNFKNVQNYMMVLRVQDHLTNSQIWVGEAYTSKEYADKREVVNYLLTALFRYFGQDTGKDIRVTIKEPETIAQR